jgi:hypothetical protein
MRNENKLQESLGVAIGGCGQVSNNRQIVYHIARAPHPSLGTRLDTPS